MNLKNLALLAFALFTVTLNTACPRDLANDLVEQDKLVKDYNSKADEANGIQSDLRNNYSVWISTTSSLSLALAPDWSAKSASDKTVIRAKLMRYLELVGGMLELAGHKNVKGHTRDPIDENDLREHQASARSLVDSLDKANGKAA